MGIVRRTIRNQRAYGVFISGKDNVKKVEEFSLLHKMALDVWSVTVGDKISDEDIFVSNSEDEFSRISLTHWPDWQCKKWLLKEIKGWEPRPSKRMLESFVRQAGLYKGRGNIVTINGAVSGPDWFVFL